MSRPDVFLDPPEKIELPYDEAVTQSLWAYDDVRLGNWPERFCTDEECSALSGIPERSLLLLQTVGVLKATRAPVGGGTHRRLWHLPEAAAAAVLECLKRATNIEYRTVAKIAYHASVLVRCAFFDYAKVRDPKVLEKFEAELIVAGNTNIYLKVSDFVLMLDPRLAELAIDGVIPIAGIDGGEGLRVPLPRGETLYSGKQIDEMRHRHRDALRRARFYATVNLKNVFVQFEKDARALRASPMSKASA